jgi:hypothetical protein
LSEREDELKRGSEAAEPETGRESPS